MRNESVKKMMINEFTTQDEIPKVDVKFLSKNGKREIYSIQVKRDRSITNFNLKIELEETLHIDV